LIEPVTLSNDKGGSLMAVDCVNYKVGLCSHRPLPRHDEFARLTKVGRMALGPNSPLAKHPIGLPVMPRFYLLSAPPKKPAPASVAKGVDRDPD
jgi:hypothetical protein